LRAVLDPNVLIAGLLSVDGAPSLLLERWLAGAFELVASEKLLNELERVLDYPKLRRRIDAGDAAAFMSLLRDTAHLVSDPSEGTHRSADRDDDYLLALAEAASAILVSGDRHLLDLAGDLPIRTARAFLDSLSGA
jgi:putative PIN family toxin of toxin-antitoxin system